MYYIPRRDCVHCRHSEMPTDSVLICVQGGRVRKARAERSDAGDCGKEGVMWQEKIRNLDES